MICLLIQGEKVLKNRYKRIIVIFLLFFPLLFLSGTNNNNDSKEVKKILNDIQKEKEYLKKWEESLNAKKMALSQWEQTLNQKAEELKLEKERLKKEWANLKRARIAKKIDSKILKLFETLDTSVALGYLLDYYKTDKEKFYSIFFGVKKGVRMSFIEDLAVNHKDIFLDILNYMEKQAGYKNELNKIKKMGKQGG